MIGAAGRDFFADERTSVQEEALVASRYISTYTISLIVTRIILTSSNLNPGLGKYFGSDKAMRQKPANNWRREG